MEWASMCSKLETYIVGKDPNFPEDWPFFKNMEFMVPILEKSCHQQIKDRHKNISEVDHFEIENLNSCRKPKSKKKFINPYKGISRFEARDQDSDESNSDEEEQFNISKDSRKIKPVEMESIEKTAFDEQNFSNEVLDVSSEKEDSTDMKISKLTKSLAVKAKGQTNAEKLIEFQLHKYHIKMIARVEERTFLYDSSSHNKDHAKRIAAFTEIANELFNKKFIAQNPKIGELKMKLSICVHKYI